MDGTDESEAISETTPRQIHITTCKIPTTYEAVLSVVPLFHARPPVLPESQDPNYPNLSPHEDGFDLCLHVGVAGRGPLRVERVGHKKGYNMKDASGKLAPIVPVSISTEESGPAAGASDSIPPSEVQRAEMERLGYDPFGRLEDPVDGGDIPTRGLGKGYEAFDDEIHTDIDALKLVHFLKETGFEVNIVARPIIYNFKLIISSRTYTHLWTQATIYVTTSTTALWQKRSGQTGMKWERTPRCCFCTVLL